MSIKELFPVKNIPQKRITSLSFAGHNSESIKPFSLYYTKKDNLKLSKPNYKKASMHTRNLTNLKSFEHVIFNLNIES